MQFRGELLRFAFGQTDYPQWSAVILLLTVIACLAGCVNTRVTQPLLVGPDTYALSSRTYHGSTNTARDAAVSAANEHCARLSKKLLVLSSSTNISFRADETVTSPSADEAVVDMTFRCLAAGDPELHKPIGSSQR
jgi:hypothetical protein